MKWKVDWTLVYAANLIVCWLMASNFVFANGWRGVGLAIAIYWIAGIGCCILSDFIARSLLIGGVIVGLSQLYPLLQFHAGIFAMQLTERLGQTVDGGNGLEIIREIPGGFLATIITGGILISIALASGMILNSMYYFGWERSTRDPATDPDRQANDLL